RQEPQRAGTAKAVSRQCREVLRARVRYMSSPTITDGEYRRMIRNKFWLMIAAGVICLSAVPAQADVKPHALFTDNMVLQQGIKVPVWGTADDGEKVTVTLQGQEQTTTAKDGKWLVRFDDLKVGGPYEMTISGNNKVELKNVLVGEVWVCSGQSNMEWPVRSSTDAQKNIENSRNPQLRLFTVPHAGAAKPQASVKGEW